MFLADLDERDSSNPRDEFMAETISWILERESKIVVSAHNAHVQRVEIDGLPTLGQLLESRMSRDLVVIGTSCETGTVYRERQGVDGDEQTWAPQPLSPPPPGTMDAVMASEVGSLCAIDLRTAPEELTAVATAIRYGHDSVVINPIRAFDVIIHVPHLTEFQDP